MIAWIANDAPFPPIERALDDPNGLLAAGGDLSPRRLVAAYRQGIFPWYSEGQPILWWSPDPRMVLNVANFRTSRSLRKTVRRRQFEIRCNTAFKTVVEACSAIPRAGQYGTWITPAMINAYTHLHHMGYAQSIEAWRNEDLVGGLYGLALGRVFFGESMFAYETDASKVALVGLIEVLRRQNVALIDCQQETAHLARFGAQAIPRRSFAAQLATLIDSSDAPPAWPSGPIQGI